VRIVNKLAELCRKNPTAVFTVVYPGVECFLNDYFRSLSDQTKKDFDVFIVNNGIKGFDRFLRKYPQLSVTVFESHGSPIKVRENGLNMVAQHGYDDVIFTDSDDYFDEHRIERTVGYLRSQLVVINDLHLVDAKSKHIDSGYLSRRLMQGSFINADDLVEMNVCGFSNMAMKGNLLDGHALFDENIIALDWYFFTHLLMGGVRAVFVDDIFTYYRRHANSMALLSGDNETDVLKGVAVKMAHYRAMARENQRYAHLSAEYEAMDERVACDTAFKDEYVKRICSHMPRNALWWEAIRTPKEVGL